MSTLQYFRNAKRRLLCRYGRAGTSFWSSLSRQQATHELTTRDDNLTESLNKHIEFDFRIEVTNNPESRKLTYGQFILQAEPS